MIWWSVPLRLTRIGVGRGLSKATLHRSRQFRMVSVSRRRGQGMRAAYAGPALGGGPAPVVSVQVCPANSDNSGDLTSEALIGAFIGSASAQDDRDGRLDAEAEALSITRLEGSRWRGGRLWSCKLGSLMARGPVGRVASVIDGVTGVRPWIGSGGGVCVA